MIGSSTLYAITSADYGYFQVKNKVYVFDFVIDLQNTKFEEWLLMSPTSRNEFWRGFDLLSDWYMVFLRKMFSIATQSRIGGDILHIEHFWKGWNAITDGVVCVLLNVKRSWCDNV